MSKKLLNCFVCFSLLIATSEAFWWARSTTETPQPVIKEIPLTYFRTYTYQPLSSSALQLPFFTYSGLIPQTPVAANPRFDSMANGYMPLPYNQQAESLYGQPLPLPSATVTPTTSKTTTTTSTTTTTTPKPTTTTTTTTSTTPSTTSTTETFSDHHENRANGEYPTFNRRLYANSNFYRPHYPYPEYYNYNPGFGKLRSGIATNFAGQKPSHVQFVPCMCPVSVGVPSGLPIAQPSPSALYLQSRTATDDDADMTLPNTNQQSESPNEAQIEVILKPDDPTEDGYVAPEESKNIEENFSDFDKESSKKPTTATVEVLEKDPNIEIPESNSEN